MFLPFLTAFNLHPRLHADRPIPNVRFFPFSEATPISAGFFGMQAIGAKPDAASPWVNVILAKQVFSLRSAHDATNGAYVSATSAIARGKAYRA